jgi:2-hydroxy-3-keto-5-methylthiopentenyl-1-phosphate phosphatase
VDSHGSPLYAVNAYENGLIDIHVRQLDSLTELLDTLGIPSVDEINSGFDKNNMQVRGQAFANAVDQLKASVECTTVVETKIQAALSFMDIHLVHDNYSVSSEPWIAVIQADGK